LSIFVSLSSLFMATLKFIFAATVKDIYKEFELSTSS